MTKETIISILIIIVLLLTVRSVSRDPTPVSYPRQEMDRTHKGDRAGGVN